jgi:hypothetical protein
MRSLKTRVLDPLEATLAKGRKTGGRRKGSRNKKAPEASLWELFQRALKASAKLDALLAAIENHAALPVGLRDRIRLRTVQTATGTVRPR